MSTILFELGSEELPPKSLKPLRDSLQASVESQLKDADISYDSLKVMAAPRRLSLLIEGISDKQPDRIEQKRGPAVKAAYDSEGKPTRAAEGFAKGLGIDVSELMTIETDKGDYIGYELTVQGQETTELLPNIFQNALDNLPIAKRMRSGASREEFVRPVKWLVLMQDDQVVPATIQGLQSGNQTLGHRYHSPEPMVIPHAKDYESVLEAAKVIVDFDRRQQLIVEAVQKLSDEVNAEAIVPQDLLDEVTALVDLPVALRASFEERFLQVPQEALISTMQADQKYFCLTDKEGKLQPYFIFISNIESKDPSQVVSGNEKVVRPRLADAEFFFLQDQKQPLIEMAESLKNRVFQDKLGTIWEKSERIAKLATFIARQLKEHAIADYADIEVEQATRAAMLSKADLTSTLVGEFPELQGVAGTYYARLNGEPETIAAAIEEQYLPKFSGDVLPQTAIGICLALADRLDTLVGIFGIDQAPTGSKDPFSLRRSAIGVLRILIEKKLPINLKELVEQAINNYQGKLADESKTLTQVMDFINSRYRAMYTEQGISVDSIQAVLAINSHVPLDFDQRLHAVSEFRNLPQAATLAEINKRVANILAKSEGEVSDQVTEDLLAEEAEKTLYQAVTKAEATVAPLQADANYNEILQSLATLEAPLTGFFDNVMVNSEDEALKANRLTLLKQVRELFLTVADVGELQI
ncbi:glycine--tRNA ligase subunit beta [Psychrobacter sanguinis]|uniref:glycine--tRNA ligase subunit beta n=1 Tax=Psychrobacter sanguinis TaxID=861445 RepID=UPI00020C829C|nr:glycine--tRNA ligase subunit beta [Psychrobacter sanguinis]EGK07530.1 glycyl-tRNA synthetase beta subunit [Psychrobacter sp. 1501(2011)]MCC3309262.1 glycine--tRNA ligase subunit beta [Psychrobacter sanguinis]MCD9151970.1 glycine--tRNA ligase subunit beta [Psychrobacter sanguinis]UEC26537.1 glycine--tRNA ligase subunit beta [Psychrobacter sanguinis]